LYANGAVDPYMPLGITVENGNDTNPNTEAYTLPGEAHCSDLSYSANEAEGNAKFQDRFLVLAKEWLQ
jgi:hypothetical protein